MSDKIHSTAEVVVIGGGVIGMSIALRLAKDGRNVVIIEPNDLGAGASYGNAGTIADYATLPVANAGVFRDLPRLLFDRDSPMSLRMSAIPALTPWLMRFGFNCLPHRARANAATLGALLADSTDLWREFAKEIGASDQLHKDGCLYVFDSKKSFASAGYEERMRRDYGVDMECLSADDVAKLEPNLKPFEGGAHYFPNAINIDDPGLIMQKIAKQLNDAGVDVIRASVDSLERSNGKVRLLYGTSVLHAQTAIIAAGAHSGHLAAQAGDPLPLDSERGYHIEYRMEKLPVNRVVCSATRGFYYVPMRGRLRVAGTIELAGLRGPANERRYETLVRGAKVLLPTLGEPDKKWFGFRPSMPDSIPVVRPSQAGKNVILAFGHGHLGLTLAPKTALTVARLMKDR